ncbi:LysR family transcriptional regulator [Neptunicella marina]|uniref:LysR family transcriptional regulator n=1 Tax=Neptunicella marina TaxID=2125989 RepID=A0A8J6ITZ6_9ALTE|nr:LysR family transcriptional regulator [Neptunicella marina]MBC3765588.1 LysR family transcriptional regulator [Neptunicella marina]
MRALQDLKIFIEAAKCGNLSKVADLMELTPAATSAAIKRLEAQVGVPLMVRSTRSSRLTQAGEIFLDHCIRAVSTLEEGIDLLSSEQISGKFTLSLPSDLGRNFLMGALDDFMQHHPSIRLHLQVSDRVADFYRHPVDFALRYGQLKDSQLVALPVCAENHRVLVASPDYIRQFGKPDSPQALTEHNCLRFMLDNQPHSRWQFERNKQQIKVEVQGNRVADDADVVRRWAVAGKGIAYKSLLDVAEDIVAGRLVRLCRDWQGEAVPLCLISADRRMFTPATLALKNHLTQVCKQRFALLQSELA